ncbi:hypothetical protein [Bosea sp. 2RAB26]|uniref:hypothetical protein n=1 Tax=Bosea sp. 2RAB26 TaxID=3237476 RepID=UPI003F925B62
MAIPFRGAQFACEHLSKVYQVTSGIFAQCEKIRRKAWSKRESAISAPPVDAISRGEMGTECSGDRVEKRSVPQGLQQDRNDVG